MRTIFCVVVHSYEIEVGQNINIVNVVHIPVGVLPIVSLAVQVPGGSAEVGRRTDIYRFYRVDVGQY